MYYTQIGASVKYFTLFFFLNHSFLLSNFIFVKKQYMTRVESGQLFI